MTDTTDDIVGPIRVLHRNRRFAMKLQQKIDRALESFIRVNETAWSPELPEEDRAAMNREVKRIIAAARKGEGLERIKRTVVVADLARSPADELRKDNEKKMEKQAHELPVWPWVEAVRGAGDLGLATIVAEAGNLSNYANPGKLWKRLGFAPYDGRAGSTWKRESWRDRALTKEEWMANPFSGQRYALMHQVAIWLRNAQWIGADKTEDGEGKPDGPYGELYAARRAHTALTHPDWSKMHSDKDALRYMMKRFLRNLWSAWRAAEKEKGQAIGKLSPNKRSLAPADAATHAMKPKGDLPRRRNSEKGRASEPLSPSESLPAPPADAAKSALKPKRSVPRRKNRAPPASSPLSPKNRMPEARDDFSF